MSNTTSMYNTITLILSLLVAVVILATIAPKLKLPYSILLVLGGLILGFIPGLPRIVLNPDLILLLFLPPLLYSSAWVTSWRDFRANMRPISLLAIGLVLMTTILVAVVAHAAIPEMPWASAFVLGAIVSPTDSVAATSIAQRLGIPRRIVSIIEGESMVNDATGLVAYRFAVAAVVTGVFSLEAASLQFVIVSVGGIAIGFLIGWPVAWLHRHLDDASIEITITLLTPFAAYLLAETLNVSGVLAAVTTGLYVARQSSRIFSANTRLQAEAVWEMVIFLLNSLIFILIGLQLRGILDTLTNLSPITLIEYALLISLAVIVIRIIWVFSSTYLSRLLDPSLRTRDPYPGWRNVVIVSWTGMRGGVSLAAALALPLFTNGGIPFPGRDLVIFLTFCVILSTLVVQGLTLAPLIHLLGLKDDGSTRSEEMQARLAAMHAAVARIEELSKEDWVPPELAAHLRSHYEKKINGITAHFEGAEGGDNDGHLTVYQRLQEEILKAERSAIISMRDQRKIGDEVLHSIERELDLEEERLEV